jgi:hypothetical protein
MRARKQFRAQCVRVGPYHRADQRRGYLTFAGKVFSAAIGGGLLVGALSTPVGRQQLSAASVSLGIARARTPQPGDYWPRCADARAAGTAPIYRGEPGYRDRLDGDNDGIACEPYRGR